MRVLRLALPLPWSFGLFLLVILPCQTIAQEREPADIIKVNTDLVVFDAQVINKKTKQLVSGLTKEDFELTDKGVRQQITYLSRDELPLSINLLLDVSRSVRSIIHDIRDGALNALRRLKPDDQVAVMAFATTSKLAQNFTKDRGLTSRKIEEATATAALGDATFVARALESAAIHMQSAPAPRSRRVIIVITDNIAASAGRIQQDALDQLLETGAVVYGLIVRGPVGKVFNIMSFGQIKGVNKFVDETGGEILGADKKEVDARLGEVIDRLRARYAIGFRPTNITDDNSFRRVEIRIPEVRQGKEKLVVLTKRGYYLRRKQ